ncbi:MAG: YncE family protein, partial [Candidatus Acidiferrales bacterium]
AGIAFDGVTLWVATNGTNSVARVSPSTGAVLATFSTGKSPMGVAFDGSNIWVANFGSNSVSTTLVK